MRSLFYWFDVSHYSDQLLYEEQMDDGFIVVWQHVIAHKEKMSYVV